MIQVGKIINSALLAANLQCWPIVAPEGTELPFIVYSRTFNSEYTKDGRAIDTGNIDMYVLSESYAETVTMAQQIDAALSAVQGDYTDMFIFKCKLLSGDEIYQDGVYIQKLTFEIKAAS